MDPNRIKSEATLENELMKQLESLGYKRRTEINNINLVNENLKLHLERLNSKELNNKSIPDGLFKTYVLDKIANNSVFDNANLFRDLIAIPKGIGSEQWRLKCFDKSNFENNVFEFSHQIVQDSREGNRGDVTLFLNGFPVVQIELKRKDVEIKEAFNQINRYKNQSFNFNIFKIIQLFIVSNGNVTRYFSNYSGSNRFGENDKKILFNWSDENNEKLSDLKDFAESFLNKKTLFKMLTDYMVLTKDNNVFTLRPYQFYAVESILNHIEKNNKFNDEITNLDERSKLLNGYIWHATGSGKTLTSFKVADLLSKRKEIEKVVFLVDRIDLNSQTSKEFKKYLGENYDELKDVNSSEELKKQLKAPEIKMIVTTMQKMDKALKSDFVEKNKELFNKNFVFVIDECHRTQFGEMHKLLRKTFIKSRLIGFTGTPIFACDEKNFMTTKDIFGNNLHKYLMMNAIADENVLKFHIEYLKGPKSKFHPDNDVEVEAIDQKGFFGSEEYIEKVVDYIYKINPTKTNNNYFKSMLVCSDIDFAIKYYWKFREKYPDFKVATLFSSIDNNHVANEDRKEIEGAKNTKEELAKIIVDYNNLYKKNCSEKELKTYSYDIQNDLSLETEANIQLIIVVRMLTTGFNAKRLNTVYLDRTIKGYEVIQTISRANRTFLGKNIANVVSFRTFKADVDSAICLYNDTDSPTFIFEKKSLDELINEINKNIEELVSRWPSHNDIDNEKSEIVIKDFVTLMKKINKLLSIAQSFIEFDFKLLKLTRDEIENYRSIYKDKHDKVRNNVLKESILNDIDFELEIIAADEINVDYIMQQLDTIKKFAKDEIFSIKIDEILSKIDKKGLQSKAKLLKEFIETWRLKMLSDELDDWKDISTAEAYSEYRIETIKNKIIEFSEQRNLRFEKIIEIIKEKRYQQKSLDSYTEEIEKCINDKSLSFLDRDDLISEIKEFIVNVESDYYIETIIQNKTLN